MGRDIKQLHPRLQAKIVKLKQLCEKEGLKLGIGECFRTVEEQNALYAKGRTRPGRIVTNAKGTSYSSQHQWGVAFDFFKNVEGKEYSDVKFFNKVGALAKSIGLGWGGDWKNPVDKPHLYLPDWGSTTAGLKRKYGTPAKFKATWHEEPEPAKKPVAKPKAFKVRVTGLGVRVRTGPGTNYRDTGKRVKRKSIYTIVETKSGKGAKQWGKLKGGAGWIALTYTKKI